MCASAGSFKSFVGVDLHKCTVTLAAVDAAGEAVARLTINTRCVDKIEQWLLALPRPTHLAVEACPFTEWFIDRYTPCVDRMDIADATELANRRGKRRKNDRNDAQDIARRLARGECPLGFIANPTLMQLRKLGRHWRQLSRLLSRSKQAMKSILNATNLRGPKFDGAAPNVGCLPRGICSAPLSIRRSPTAWTSCCSPNATANGCGARCSGRLVATRSRKRSSSCNRSPASVTGGFQNEMRQLA